jgi:hypothetical protein
MKLTRVENRCRHGFLVGSKLCPACEGGAVERNPNKVTCEVLVPGFDVGGSTIVSKSGEDVTMCCGGCGEQYRTTRTALLKVRHRKTRSCCANCRRKPWNKETAA